MPVDHIRYDLLTQQALRGVLRTVLSDVAKSGLPGDHHFFITFDTREEGVRLSQSMRAQYPQEMTIVLQHQFWDLTVGEDMFEVGLSFGGVPEKLAIPFAAVKGFFDPAVQFGLQFEQVNEIDDDDEMSPAAAPAPKQKTEPPGPTSNKNRRATPAMAATPKTASNSAPKPASKTAPQPLDPPSPDAEEQIGQAAENPPNRGEVVSLDLFRKK
jgi:hypothetical protein